jgi:hypothetical protein
LKARLNCPDTGLVALTGISRLPLFESEDVFPENSMQYIFLYEEGFSTLLALIGITE